MTTAAPAHLNPQLALRGTSYYALWYDPEQRRQLRKSMRTADARTAHLRFADFLSGAIPATVQEPATCARILDDYKREHVQPHVADIQRRERLVTVLRGYFQDTPVRGLNKTQIDGYAETRRSAGIANGTIRLELGALVAAINHARKCGRLTAAEVPAIEMPAAPSGRARWLTGDELARLRNSADVETQWWLDIAYWTGARKDAVETLMWKQIDLARSCVHLNPDGRAQTRKRRPTVPIVGELQAILESLPRSDETGYIFGEGFEVRRGFERACRLAGLQDVTPHTIRHTRATHLLQAGVDIWAVAGLLGDSITTVQRTYGHHCLGHLAAALETKK